MDKTVKMSKRAVKDDFRPTLLGAEGSIHINPDQEIITGYQPGIKEHKYRRMLDPSYVPVNSSKNHDNEVVYSLQAG